MNKLHWITGAAYVSLTAIAGAQIEDFGQWTLLEDPPNALFSASSSSNSVTLSAASDTLTSVPSGTDIGFASINGPTFAASDFGYGFDPSANFKIMVDYDLSFLPSVGGGLVIGFGVGEDTDGANSAGVVYATNNGIPLLVSTAARVNDETQLPTIFSPNKPLVGSFSVEYYANSGSIWVGTGDFGANIQTESKEITDIQNQWGDAVLFPSVFLRSQNLGGGEWSSGASTGSAEAVFSNFRIINGEEIRATNVIPEPQTYAALGGLLALLLALRYRRR